MLGRWQASNKWQRAKINEKRNPFFSLNSEGSPFLRCQTNPFRHSRWNTWSDCDSECRDSCCTSFLQLLLGKKVGVSLGNSRVEIAEAEAEDENDSCTARYSLRCGGSWSLSPEVYHDFKTKNLAFILLY